MFCKALHQHILQRKLIHGEGVNMSALNYLLVSGRAELSSFLPDGKKSVCFSFSPTCHGFLRLGAHSLPIKDGKCSIQLCELGDGVYEPTIILSKKSYTLGMLKIEGGHIEPLPISEGSQRELYIRVGQLEEELMALSKTVEQLRLTVYGKIL